MGFRAQDLKLRVWGFKAWVLGMAQQFEIGIGLQGYTVLCKVCLAWTALRNRVLFWHPKHSGPDSIGRPNIDHYYFLF